MISSKLKNIQPSASLAIASRVMELKKQGRQIISLAIGEPDFDTPEHIKQAAVKAMQDGFTKYTEVDGTSDLKNAIVEKFQRENGLKYKPNEIIVSAGAKHSFYNVCQAVLDKGDEVIIPAPYWVSYPEIVKLAEGVPVYIKTDLAANFKITPDQLEKHITSKTKMLILNSPSNPTGMVYTRDELKALADILLRHPNILIVSDDIYEHIIWNNTPFTNILNVCPLLRERVIVINGVSKTYAMTGWRIGYAAGNSKIIDAMKKVQSQSISCPVSISQAAAVAALNGDQSCVAKMNQAYRERHDYLVANLAKIPEFKFSPADGAFYLFIDVTAAMKKFGCDSDIKFVDMLLDKAGVSVLPGSVFGLDNHVRISFATSMENIKNAVRLMTDFIEN